MGFPLQGFFFAPACRTLDAWQGTGEVIVLGLALLVVAGIWISPPNAALRKRLSVESEDNRDIRSDLHLVSLLPRNENKRKRRVAILKTEPFYILLHEGRDTSQFERRCWKNIRRRYDSSQTQAGKLGFTLHMNADRTLDGIPWRCMHPSIRYSGTSDAFCHLLFVHAVLFQKGESCSFAGLDICSPKELCKFW